MKKTLRQLSISAAATTSFFLLSASVALAQITNPAVEGPLGNEGTTETFTNYFASLWKAILAIGAIATLVLFLWGALEWIVSAGDKGKLENARNRITNAIIGLIILVGAFVILQFLSTLLFGETFQIFELNLPDVLNGGVGSPPGT
jgi:membrane protease YdiL (CAAX protease family)